MWTGGQGHTAYKPHPYPPYAHSQTQTSSAAASKMCVFALFNLIITDQWTNRPTDLWTDIASYRVTCPKLKTNGEIQKSKKVAVIQI